MNDFDEYQELSKETAQGYANPEMDNPRNTREGDREEQIKLLFLTLAMNGEAGELGEKVKKAVREDDDEYLEAVKAEMGDVLWYMAQLATLLDIDLGNVAAHNLDKLYDRDERGMITGEGDHR